jgi:site-specific DNA-adenine methylase
MLGLPYQGSKRKLAKKIVDYIIEHNPNATVFYDLFGGGGAITFEALKRKQFKKVVYNELDTGVVELLKKIQKDGVTDEFYKWVSKETFDKLKKENTWVGGLARTCWSFGCAHTSYAFGVGIEELKKLMHTVIVDCCNESIDRLSTEYKINIHNEILAINHINGRRLSIQRALKTSGIIFYMEQFGRIQQLERIQNTLQSDKLELHNKSALDFIIDTDPKETVIYLDPPYAKTTKYFKDVNHNSLYEFIEKNIKYKIYLSSYESPLECVAEYKHRTTKGANINREVTEGLFCNQKEQITTSLL